MTLLTEEWENEAGERERGREREKEIEKERVCVRAVRLLGITQKDGGSERKREWRDAERHAIKTLTGRNSLARIQSG